MNNIRPDLDAMAREIASAPLASNRDLEDAITKIASERGLSAGVIQALTPLVNRHVYKRAMLDGRKDESPLADAGAILHRMRPAATKSAAATAAPTGFGSGGIGVGGQFSGAPKPLNVGPMMTAKYASQERGLETEVKGLNAQVRQGKQEMIGLAKFARQVGLVGTAGFDDLIAAQPEYAQSLMREAVEKCAATVWPYSPEQLKLYLPTAIAQIEKMAAIAGSIHDSEVAILDAKEKLDHVRAELGVFRGGYRL